MGRRLTRDELTGACVSEVRSVGPLDADASVARFTSCEWSTAADHVGVALPATGGRALASAGRDRPAVVDGTPIRCHVPWPAVRPCPSPTRSTVAQYSFWAAPWHSSRGTPIGHLRDEDIRQAEDRLPDPPGVVVVEELLDPVARQVLGEQDDHD